MFSQINRDFVQKYADILSKLEIVNFTLDRSIIIEFNINNDTFLREMLCLCPKLSYTKKEWILSFRDAGDYVIRGPKYEEPIQPIGFWLGIHESTVLVIFLGRWRALDGKFNTNTDGNIIIISN